MAVAGRPVRARHFASLKVRLLAGGFRGRTLRVVSFLAGVLAGLYLAGLGFLLFAAGGALAPELAFLVAAAGGTLLVTGAAVLPPSPPCTVRCPWPVCPCSDRRSGTGWPAWRQWSVGRRSRRPTRSVRR